MSKTRIRPNAVKSKSAGIKPYLEKQKTAFPDMMRRYTQAARDWDQKEAHSENIKPYLFDQDVPYPEIDYIFPTPFSLEFPGFSSEEWTNIGEPGEESWRFQCIIHCKHTTKPNGCPEPVKCWYGAWTAEADGNPDGWKFFDSDGNNITEEVKLKWHPEAGFNGELWVLPKTGSWHDLLNGESETITARYLDKGQKEGKYFHPIIKKWITIAGGRSTCDTRVLVRCKDCPVDPVLTFDDASTPNTITPGNYITLYISDGLAPFQWTVSGTGYTLSTHETVDHHNTLYCASGTCGDDYDPSAYITVVDACGTEVEFAIQSTGGSWDNATVCFAGYLGDPPCNQVPAGSSSGKGSEGDPTPFTPFAKVAHRCWALDTGECPDGDVYTFTSAGVEHSIWPVLTEADENGCISHSHSWDDNWTWSAVTRYICNGANVSKCWVGGATFYEWICA
jgi:hypothetical protein